MADFSDWKPAELIARKKENLQRIRELRERREQRRAFLIQTFSPSILATHFGIVVGQTSELHRLEQQLSGIERILRSVAGSGEAKLTEKEDHILEALGVECLTGEEIAKRAGWPYNSNFKGTLSSLCKRGILENLHPRYRRKHPQTNRGE